MISHLEDTDSLICPICSALVRKLVARTLAFLRNITGRLSYYARRSKELTPNAVVSPVIHAFLDAAVFRALHDFAVKI